MSSRALTSVLAALVAVACRMPGPPADAGASASADPSTDAPATDAPSEAAVVSLGLRFRLPDHLSVVEDPGFVFLARSSEPPAILSIAAEDADVLTHPAEEGETLSDVTIGGVEAVVVADAVVEGLPPGITANELLVANGARSFSLILSAPPDELAALWDPLIGSISLD